MRLAQVNRKTSETEISVVINLDGSGQYDNQTGVGFFDHLLDLEDELDPAFICASKFKLVDIPPAPPATRSRIISIEDAIKNWLKVVG